MANVTTLTWSVIVNLVANAKERVCLIMPAIHEEWVEMFKLCMLEVRISICVEISEEVTRRGYGDTRLVRRLQKMGIEVKEADKLKLQFLSVDGKGWCIYTESHILSSDVGGVNAIELGQADTEGIIADIFGYSVGRNGNQIARDVNQENLKSIEAQLELTPPVSPDIERRIRVYTNYFQTVELNLKKFGFLNKKIRLPEKELGYWGRTNK